MAESGMPEDDASEQNGEPDDPFADLKVMERPAEGEMLTTQVVPSETRAQSESAPPAERGAASQYCTNIADAAIDARIAWQRQNLAEAEKEVQRRTTELEVKTAEYQRWLTRRDEFAQKAQKAIIDIYSKMKPDAAALQLQALDDETAAAVIIKLDARVASSVMNEMDPAQAARLTAILSGAAEGPRSRSRQAPPAGNRS
jgi:flagellar motility protein MotE (MotC chaperone)